jgi:hypothetical protein
MPLPPLSYAQRFEDFHLWRCFGDQERGSTSTSAPDTRSTTTCRSPSISRAGAASRSSRTPALAALGRAVRPRDHLHEGLAGAAAGAATLYLQREFHGLSTTIAEHARQAEKEVSRQAEALTLPVTDARGAVRSSTRPQALNSSRWMSKAPRPTCCAAPIFRASGPG